MKICVGIRKLKYTALRQMLVYSNTVRGSWEIGKVGRMYLGPMLIF